MEKYFSLTEVPQLESSILTIGTFDGLHRGHQEIIKHLVTVGQAKKLKSVVITFNPHPQNILADQKVALIQNINKKFEVFESLGVNAVIVIPFDLELSEMRAQTFLDSMILPKLNPKHIVIGFDHHFGKNRQGTPQFMKKYCDEHGIALDVIDPIANEGNKISSSGIRKLITSGYVRRASFELGRVFGFDTKVVHGKGRGRLLDYPTANIIPIEKDQLLPKVGVYFTRARVNGLQLYGMCNFGVRPTFGDKELVMEVHFFDPKITDLYEYNVYIEFLERIRNEEKFKSEDDLKKQLIKDKNLCKILQTKYMQG